MFEIMTGPARGPDRGSKGTHILLWCLFVFAMAALVGGMILLSKLR